MGERLRGIDALDLYLTEEPRRRSNSVYGIRGTYLRLWHLWGTETRDPQQILLLCQPSQRNVEEGRQPEATAAEDIKTGCQSLH